MNQKQFSFKYFNLQMPDEKQISKHKITVEQP